MSMLRRLTPRLAMDAVRTQLWPLPTGAVVLALVSGVLLPRMDRRVDAHLPRWLADLLFGGDPGAARTLLDAVSSSLITVTSLTFSLTVVTLQLASSQFSPRLLRTFTRDVFVQGTLALFLATFTYALTVLRAVRSQDGSVVAFVPQISVTVGFVLAVVSVVGLVLFLAHLVAQIRVETTLRNVHAEASATVRAVLKPPASASDIAGNQARMPVGNTTDRELLVGPKSGFLMRVDEAQMLSCATDLDLVVVIDVFPGTSIIRGSPIGQFWSRSGATLTTADRDAASQRLAHTITTGFERTSSQDIGYGLRQLTDVAIKALSPGINDPTTAIHALGHISALLCEMAVLDLGPVTLSAGDVPRVRLARPGLADLLDAAVTQPRRYGASDPQVAARLYALLAELGWHARPVDRGCVHHQLARLDASVAAHDFDETERTRFAELKMKVEAALVGSWRE